MTRKYIDCRETLDEFGCTLAISGTEDEVLELAVQNIPILLNCRVCCQSLT